MHMLYACNSPMSLPVDQPSGKPPASTYLGVRLLLVIRYISVIASNNQLLDTKKQANRYLAQIRHNIVTNTIHV